MRRNVAKVMALILCGSLAAGPASAAVTDKDRRRARLAVRYLTANQTSDGAFLGSVGFTADGILSLVAARRAPGAIKKALAYLEAEEAQIDTVGEIAKAILALRAAGGKPRAFAGRNLVKEIRDSETSEGRYGEGSPVVDHALAMLALSAVARVAPSDAAATWLADAQCDDGGWQFDGPPTEAEDESCRNTEAPNDDFFISETDATSYAIQALAIHPGDASPKNNPFKYLRERRDETRGGWGYSVDFPLTSANSTSLALQAYVSAGRRLPRGSKGALRRLQYKPCSKHGAAFAFTWEPKPAGGFKRSGPDVLATIDGIRGLLEQPLPLARRTVTKRPPKPRCG